MQVVHETPQQLVVQDRPVIWAVVSGTIIFTMCTWGLAGLADGEFTGVLIALAIASAMAYVMLKFVVKVLDVRFNRPDNEIRVRTTTLLGKTEAIYPLGQLEQVSCDVRYSDDNGRPDYGILLRFVGRDAPADLRLESFQLSPEDALDVSGALSRWLETSAHQVDNP